MRSNRSVFLKKLNQYMQPDEHRDQKLMELESHSTLMNSGYESRFKSEINNFNLQPFTDVGSLADT